MNKRSPYLSNTGTAERVGRLLICAGLAACTWSCATDELTDDSGEQDGDVENESWIAPARGARVIDVQGLRPDVMETLHPGDQIVDRSIGLGAIVPEPGQTITAVADRDDGGDLVMTIETGTDGGVNVNYDGISFGQNSGSGRGPRACSDGGYNRLGFRYNKAFVWFFNSGSTPLANSVDAVETRLKEAVTNITRARTSCGLADVIHAYQEYHGRTSRGTNINGSTTGVSCGTSDGYNVVGFNTLPGGTLAVTCTWSSNGIASSSDIKFNNRVSWFASAGAPVGCWNQFGIEPIGTHEFGHAFGLGHVSESNHAKATMSPYITMCSTVESSLGWGDWRGLAKLYPAQASASSLSDVQHAPSSTPLWRYWNGTIGDHFYTTGRNDAGLAYYGYGSDGIEGYILPAAEDETVPLYRYWNPGVGDHFYTTDWNELGWGANGWGYEAVAGHIYNIQWEGTIPLYRYWNTTIKDHFYSVTRNDAGYGYFGYAFEKVTGYVFP
jgi:hypothetical protein